MQIDFPGFEIAAGDTLVDVGCGDGSVCAYAGWRGADVIGIDIDPESLRQADAVMRGVPARSWRGLLSDCDPIPLPDASASVIVATEVMEHVESPERFAAELVRIGKPGARYLISVPDPASESVLKLVAPDWYWKAPFHVRVYERGQLEALLGSAGLEVTGSGKTGFYWAMWWTFRMALDAQVGSDKPDSPLLHHWERTWEELGKVPWGSQIAWEMAQHFPKSQVVVARKPAGLLGGLGGPHLPRGRWKRRLRDGLLRAFGLEFRWQVRRARLPR
jgi:SAM-dependent methyltransferase